MVSHAVCSSVPLHCMWWKVDNLCSKIWNGKYFFKNPSLSISMLHIYLQGVSVSHGTFLLGSSLPGTAGSALISCDTLVKSNSFIALSWLHSRSTTDCRTLLVSFSACTLSITLNQITPETSYLHIVASHWLQQSVTQWWYGLSSVPLHCMWRKVDKLCSKIWNGKYFFKNPSNQHIVHLTSCPEVSQSMVRTFQKQTISTQSLLIW